jgi:hypothetical protein
MRVMTVFSVREHNLATGHVETIWSTEYTCNPEWTETNRILADQRAEHAAQEDSETDHYYDVMETER